jgi:hypothetical protein
MFRKSVHVLLLFTCLISCMEKNKESLTSPLPIKEPSEEFKKLWYNGKAELSSYHLEQARYGEIRQGDAVLIFVTEDFSTKKLVKLDDPATTNEKSSVLKLNMTKNFITGIYPYSMMLSVFTPASANGKEQTLKVTSSSQEWCGQTFSQLELGGNEYNWKQHSYFEQDGEQDIKVGNFLLEDEIWNRIRLNPDSLPTGIVKMLPGLLWQRLAHHQLMAEDAVLTLANGDENLLNTQTTRSYTVNYPALKRTLKIFFSKAFPYQIVSWEETYEDGFGNNKKMLTTKARLKKTLWLDYWKYNKTADAPYRDSLQLNAYE